MIANLRVYAVRGAVCCENTVESIRLWTVRMYRSILEDNALSESDLVSVQFTVTADLDMLNPASALRQQGCASSVPLFVSAEPVVRNAPSGIIRTLITAYSSKPLIPAYLNGAEILRPDLARMSTIDVKPQDGLL